MPVATNFKGVKVPYHNPFELAAHDNLVQSRDFLAALKSKTEMSTQEVAHKQPRDLIETMRIVGSDLLTASDSALYELLLANAKHSGIDRLEHTIAVSHVQSFLGIRHLERIVDSVKRISRTHVEYDIRSEKSRFRGTVPLILAEVRENYFSGTSDLTYSIPERVRKAVLASSEYAMVDVAPFAEFKGKYTGRIFQRLCIRAGYDAYFNSDWKITPKDLALEIGYPHPERTHDFMKRVVLLAVQEINKHSTRFKVLLDQPEKKGTRGRAIQELVFHVEPAPKDDDRKKRATLNSEELRFIKRADTRHSPGELPSVKIVSMVMEMYPNNRKVINAFTLTDGWRCLLDRAKDNINNPENIFLNMSGSYLLDKIAENGADAVFTSYAYALQTGRERVARRTAQSVERRPYSAEDLARLQEDDSTIGRRTYRWAQIKNEVAQAQEALDGWLPGSSSHRKWTRDELAVWLDPEAKLFRLLRDDLSTQFGTVEAALKIATGFDDVPFRKTFGAFLSAIRKEEVQKVVKISKAILINNPQAPEKKAPVNDWNPVVPELGRKLTRAERLGIA
ncbi:hypothetical protein ASF70_13075 [Rhizobium sp. Leaf321]|uniref:replication initiation protein n=1 Tax=Rhizobium sp. Leaf321 TaxID=1736335 RepID=UPI000714A1E8|nr:replication initiation protein [Rhizobium sp. Leaf321]KQQ72454.1 hypothetical protein ASF70_13075 [Rhizobium sp. Leaf321]